MITYTPQSVRYTDILRAVKNRLVSRRVTSDRPMTSGETQESFIYISRTASPAGYPTERWIRIYPGSLGSVSESPTGFGVKTHDGGRWDTRAIRSLIVELFTRCDADQVGDGEVSLIGEVDAVRRNEIGAEIGHLSMEEAVIDALHMWVPTNKDINPSIPDDQIKPLTYQPIFLRSAESPPQDDRSRGYIVSRLVFETAYLMKLEIVLPDN